MAASQPAEPSAPARGGLSLALSGGWTAELAPLPSDHHQGSSAASGATAIANASQGKVEGILLASIPLSALYAAHPEALQAICNGASSGGARVALADYTARVLSDIFPQASEGCTVKTMGQARHLAGGGGGKRRRRRKVAKNKKEAPIPYVLERTDCVIAKGDNGGATLQFLLHVAFPSTRNAGDGCTADKLKDDLIGMISPALDDLTNRLTSSGCFAHVACVVLQRRLRGMLQPPRKALSAREAAASGGSEEKKTDSDGSESGDNNATPADQERYLDAVAFIADGSLLPRKSGRSSLPMASPPAVPFASPEGSEQLTRVVTVDVGAFWRRFLNEDGSVAESGGGGEKGEAAMDTSEDGTSAPPTSVTMRGMIIPRGVTLIVGGGYHGKSTMLQALCMGVYDNPPGDGRERCVAHDDAVSIRAEDGRYVNRCNVSAFISNLPSGRSINGASISSKQDTSTFSTRDASGSTSQAANVIEALEGGASALLVDEDVSAANFMARDGRMRAMIMDEPITPLLYRVNGLFLSKEHQVSTVVVVGGVGEWLDVADAVVLMKDYRAYDGLEKARSVSYQFSYGHVQYAGKGVVHRLPWEAKKEEDIMGTYNKISREGSSDEKGDLQEDDDGKKPTTISPLRRRPDSDCVARKFGDAAIHVPDGGSSRLWFYRDGESDSADGADDGDEDDGIVDLSKCSQLVGSTSEQLYGCGVCVLWLIRESQRCPDDDLGDLLDRMEGVLNAGGMKELISSLKQDQSTGANDHWLADLLASHAALDLWETVGFAYRPRRHEVAMALTRMRGMRFDILPEKTKVVQISAEEEAKLLEEESRKRALAELWANRRKR
ncbi:hypothetical protein ACHAXT_001338 [Thalassiosira profunda]